MYIDVDYNPTPSDAFFISIGLSDKEAISFDCTSKGRRVTKQKLIAARGSRETSSRSPEEITGEWDVLELKDGRLLDKRHVQWIDRGSIDEVDGDVWETEWAKPLSDGERDELLQWSRFISDNYERLNEHRDKMGDFENLMRAYLEKYAG
jgi:hypothetical protein